MNKRLYKIFVHILRYVRFDQSGELKNCRRYDIDELTLQLQGLKK